MTIAEQLKNEGWLEGKIEGKVEGLIEGIELAIMLKYPSPVIQHRLLNSIREINNIKQLQKIRKIILNSKDESDLVSFLND